MGVKNRWNGENIEWPRKDYLCIYPSFKHQALMFQIFEIFLWNPAIIETSLTNFYEIEQSLKRLCNHSEMSGKTQFLGEDDIILGKSRPPLEKLSHLKVQYCLKGGQFKNNIALKVAQSKIWFQNCTSLNNFKSPSLPSGQCGRWGLKPSV